jgi:hypothetical protein
MGKPLLQGQNIHGLYSFRSFSASNKSAPPTALVGERTLVLGWHSRLGHPAFHVVHPLLSKFQLPFSTTQGTTTSSACLSSKSHQQSFSHVHTCSLSPLEQIYTDVWGPSPICSSAGFKYYVSFLDDFSRCTWTFPIAYKSDVSAIFNQFKLYVECYFSSH